MEVYNHLNEVFRKFNEMEEREQEHIEMLQNKQIKIMNQREEIKNLKNNKSEQISEWAYERDLHKADPFKQLAKLCEEVGELAECMNKGASEEELSLELGDIFVVITILARQYNLDIDYCIDLAYNKIANRKGKTINGIYVKEEDL